MYDMLPTVAAAHPTCASLAAQALVTCCQSAAAAPHDPMQIWWLLLETLTSNEALAETLAVFADFCRSERSSSFVDGVPRRLLDAQEREPHERCDGADAPFVELLASAQRHAKRCLGGVHGDPASSEHANKMPADAVAMHLHLAIARCAETSMPVHEDGHLRTVASASTMQGAVCTLHDSVDKACDWVEASCADQANSEAHEAGAAMEVEAKDEALAVLQGVVRTLQNLRAQQRFGAQVEGAVAAALQLLEQAVR